MSRTWTKVSWGRALEGMWTSERVVGKEGVVGERRRLVVRSLFIMRCLAVAVMAGRMRSAGSLRALEVRSCSMNEGDGGGRF